MQKKIGNTTQHLYLIKWLGRNLASVVFFIALLCGFFWGGMALLDHAKLFHLFDIQVEGNTVTSTPQILEACQLEQGESLFGVNRKIIENEILKLPWIKEVQVEKHWPSSVHINVSEHRPLALVNIETDDGSLLYYLDKQGELFAEHEPGRDIDYPVVTGVKAAGKKSLTSFMSGQRAYPALYLLQLAAKGNAIFPIQTISEIHLDDREGMVVYLVDQTFPIYFGTDQVFTKYYRLVKILERLYRKDLMGNIASIRMDYMKNKVLVAMDESCR